MLLVGAASGTCLGELIRIAKAVPREPATVELIVRLTDELAGEAGAEP